MGQLKALRIALTFRTGGAALVKISEEDSVLDTSPEDTKRTLDLNPILQALLKIPTNRRRLTDILLSFLTLVIIFPHRITHTTA